MEKTKNIFQEYRRGVYPDTQAGAFEGAAGSIDALISQTKKNPVCAIETDNAWEINVVDWSRMFRTFIN